MPTEPDVREVPADVRKLAGAQASEFAWFAMRACEYEGDLVGDIRDAIAAAIMADRATRETAKAEGLLDPDMPAQELRLHMGEVTAQEMRTARAAIRWANSRTTAAKAEARREALEEARAIMRKAWDDGPGSVPGDKVTFGMAASAFSTAQIAIAAAIRAKAEG